MDRELSTVRLYSLRFFYLLNALVIGIGVWPAIVIPEKPWDLTHSVAYSLYAGYSLLMLVGVGLPLRMLPLLLLQILYKLIWLFGVACPMWRDGHLSLVSGTMKFFALVVLLDLLFIPWPYVFQHYGRPAFTGPRSLKA
jgi:hypothetical protein